MSKKVRFFRLILNDNEILYQNILYREFKLKTSKNPIENIQKRGEAENWEQFQH